MEKLDLRWGNPEFLAGYLRDNPVSNSHDVKNSSYIYNSTPELEQAIVELHRKYDNAEINDKYLVIGNGATQLLLAIMFCNGAFKAYQADYPCFSRLRSLARLANKPFNVAVWGHHIIKIITSPNNPDNSVIKDLPSKEVILDNVYNWPIYTDPIKYDADVMIFSASKAFGLASSRVGWAFIKDERLAQVVRDYVEYTTGGVAIEAQNKVINLIKDNILANPEKNIFSYGKETLQVRWKEIESIRSSIPFEVLNSSGMFLYCKGNCPETILGMSGPDMGMPNEYFRLNLGCSNEDFERLLCLIKPS
jgi:L-tryptophan---pyruvate aminotransferase